MNRTVITLGRTLILIVIIAWSLLPVYIIVSSAFKASSQIFSAQPGLFLFEPTLNNFVSLWNRWPQFFHSLWNSTVVTLGATVLVLLSCGLAGYVFSRFRSRALTASAFFMLVVRMFPPIVVSLPLFPVVNEIGLNDTLIILIVLYASFYVSLGTWIMKAFFDQVPRELDEAATMDGAGTMQVLFGILLPLARPGLVAIAVFIIVFAWNEFLFAFIFASTNARTVPLALSEMMDSSEGVDWGVLFAAATIQLVPVVALIIIAQRYLVAGLTAGSVKS